MEDNKLIAEFMGAKPIVLGISTEYEMYGIIECINDGVDEKHFFIDDEMEFHTSWDWLMPVVERIRGLEEGMLVERIDIMPNDGVAIHYSHPPKMIVVDTSKRVNTLNATYQAVVEFIKQLNKE